MPNGKFYHYYSMTSTWKCSAIGVAIADAVDGPYITQGLFVRSAEAGNNMSPDGTRQHSSNGSSVEPVNHPNCIDAQAFFDKDGKNFYVVYGSWSGGIFLFEIDIETGLPKSTAMNAESNGYGRQLIANCHSGIEAPYVIYSPESDYYYLFVSFAGLAANGGYNMRVFRSRFPYGPYEDATHPVTTADPKPLASKNLSPSAGSAMDFSNYGVKIMGGYQFAHLADQENNLKIYSGRDGFLSPGHNSAFYDPETKKYYLIHHTRFVNRGEEHQVRVREMFVNEDGWLVASPFRYDGGTVRTFNAKQLSGHWKIINHGQDNNTTAHISRSYTFNRNGTITGSGKGSWELKSDEKTAQIRLDGKLYKGLFLRCYDEYHAVWVYAFTAMSEDGTALWGATLGIPQT
jgi:arabinan endo-1,5-alpha-L-arabinosidase